MAEYIEKRSSKYPAGSSSVVMLFTLIILVIILAGCSSASPQSIEDVSIASVVETAHIQLTETKMGVGSGESTPYPDITPSETPVPSETPLPTATFTATQDTRPDPAQWSSWPVVPTISAVAREIYQRGLEMGNDPKIFSSVGDCQSEPDVFLGIYETDRYWLGDDYQYLQETIDWYNGSFSHQSQGVRDGLSAPSALSPQWADQNFCEANENPVQCELRLRKPSIIFINLGTNWKAGASAERYENYLRQIVEMVIANGTLPILSTKADNVEGDHSLNRATADVAHDYDIPLWNFWLAAQSLENGGLDAERDNIYLSFPDGWDRRNFTALETLDSIRRSLNGNQ